MSDYAARQAVSPTIPWPGEATLEFYAAQLFRLAWAVDREPCLAMREIARGLQRIAWNGRAEPPQETP